MIRKTWSPQITKFWTWKKESRPGHKNVLIVQDDFTNWTQSFPMKTKETSETMYLQRCLSPSQKSKIIHTHTFQRVCKSISSFTNGITTQAPIIAQKRRSGRKRSPQSQRRKQLSQLCKVDYQKNEERLRSEIQISTCTICTARWPMTRQHSRWDVTRSLTNHQFVFCNIDSVHPNYRERQVKSTIVHSGLIFHVREKETQESWW